MRPSTKQMCQQEMRVFSHRVMNILKGLLVEWGGCVQLETLVQAMNLSCVMMYLNRSTTLTPLICSDFKVAKCINVEVTLSFTN